jgi:electron transport complex protein RnfG
VGIGLACGLLIVSVFLVTEPIIRHNRAEALQRAIFGVLPDAQTSATFRLVAGDRFELVDGDAEDAQLVHAGYDDEQRLVGLALEAQGMGYQDVIHVLYGYSFRQDAIVGIRVLESRETPGLSPDLSQILQPIEAVKHGEKEHAWQVDGITGATISSVAIADILSRSSSFWIPRVRRGLDDFRRTE